MRNPDIQAQLNAAQAAGDLLADKLEDLQDPSQGPTLQAQAQQILDQVNRLEAMVMVAQTADITAQTPKVISAKNNLQKLSDEDASVASFVNGVDTFLAVIDTAAQTAEKTIV
jgi:hypothetical protein